MRTTPAGYLSTRETHSAGLVLVGDKVLKFKKPVDFGFLDFADRGVRERTCHREVELNRRFAPDVYLGVGEVICPDTEPEPVVVMRRMPDDRRLATLVTRGADVDADLRAVARVLATAHARSRRGTDIDSEAALPALRSRWEDSLRLVRGFCRTTQQQQTLTQIEDLVTEFLDGREPLFRRRVEEGCAVDGHGDLLCDDVFCLADGPRILDCLEFDDRLRYVDRLDDAAFLAMDLDRLGRADLGSAFLRAYAEFTGDSAPPSLVQHYVAYRAFVRAKVAHLRAEQGSGPAAAEAQRLTALTLRHLRSGTVQIVLVGGPPGTGKTTLAGAVADRLGMVLVSADRVRKELAGKDPFGSFAAGYRQGIYSRVHTRRTYDEMLHRAESLTSSGESVVLDASWSDAGARTRARAAASNTHSDLHELRCDVPRAVAVQRVLARGSTGPARSDAGAGVAVRLREDADPWPESVAVDTTGPLPQTCEEVASLLRPSAEPTHRRSVMSPD